MQKTTPSQGQRDKITSEWPCFNFFTVNAATRDLRRLKICSFSWNLKATSYDLDRDEQTPFGSSLQIDSIRSITQARISKLELTRLAFHHVGQLGRCRLEQMRRKQCLTIYEDEIKQLS